MIDELETQRDNELRITLLNWLFGRINNDDTLMRYTLAGELGWREGLLSKHRSADEPTIDAIMQSTPSYEMTDKGRSAAIALNAVLN